MYIRVPTDRPSSNSLHDFAMFQDLNPDNSLLTKGPTLNTFLTPGGSA